MANYIKASRTLEAIERAIKQDQGAAYRQHLGRVLPHIGDAYRGAEDGFRTHLGASIVGQECGRKIWYDFRWATKGTFGGRMMRLFNRGHLEEGRFIAALLTIGVQVYQQDADGKQFRISDVGGHFGGSGDGVAVGLPDLQPGTPAVTEFKTHNDKSFAKLVKDGVRSAKPEHFVQMQVYMRKMGIPVALYMAVNKNNDDLHAEIIHLESQIADQFIQRGRTIILAQQPPSRISNSPGWMACSWCNHKPICHLKATPERNCRTCGHSIAREDGNWYCTQAAPGGDMALDKAVQAAGCSSYQAFEA